MQDIQGDQTLKIVKTPRLISKRWFLITSSAAVLVVLIIGVVYLALIKNNQSSNIQVQPTIMPMVTASVIPTVESTKVAETASPTIKPTIRATQTPAATDLVWKDFTQGITLTYSDPHREFVFTGKKPDNSVISMIEGNRGFEIKTDKFSMIISFPFEGEASVIDLTKSLAEHPLFGKMWRNTWRTQNSGQKNMWFYTNKEPKFSDDEDCSEVMTPCAYNDLYVPLQNEVSIISATCKADLSVVENICDPLIANLRISKK